MFKKKCPKKISRHKRLNLSIRLRTAQKGQLKHRPLYLVFTWWHIIIDRLNSPVIIKVIVNSSACGLLPSELILLATPLQWISKTSLATRIGNHKRMATVRTLRDFFFHMWETQMCSAATLVTLYSGKIKSSSPLLVAWGRKSTKFSWKYWQTKSLRKVVLPHWW